MTTSLRFLALAGLLAALTAPASAQSPDQVCSGVDLGSAPDELRTVLDAFCNPQAAPGSDHSIQSADYRNAGEFLLAYQRITSSGLEPQPVRVLLYNKRTHNWTTTELSNIETEVIPGAVSPCMGALEDAEKFGALFYVNMQLSPSASCQLVITEDLKLRAVLSGWPVAHLHSGAVILQSSMVHFMPTHPLRLTLFDPRNGLTKLYPPPSDPLREAYMQHLKEIPESDRCRGETCETDVQQFDNDLGYTCDSSIHCRPDIAVSEKTGALAFSVTFSPAGFMTQEAFKSAKNRFVRAVYVYRLFPRPIAHREFLASDIQQRFGTASPEKLLTPEILSQIFAQRP